MGKYNCKKIINLYNPFSKLVIQAAAKYYNNDLIIIIIKDNTCINYLQLMELLCAYRIYILIPSC